VAITLPVAGLTLTCGFLGTSSYLCEKQDEKLVEDMCSIYCIVGNVQMVQIFVYFIQAWRYKNNFEQVILSGNQAMVLHQECIMM